MSPSCICPNHLFGHSGLVLFALLMVWLDSMFSFMRGCTNISVARREPSILTTMKPDLVTSKQILTSRSYQNEQVIFRQRLVRREDKSEIVRLRPDGGSEEHIQRNLLDPLTPFSNYPPRVYCNRSIAICLARDHNFSKGRRADSNNTTIMFRADISVLTQQGLHDKVIVSCKTRIF
jgi:hypothetical protein